MPATMTIKPGRRVVRRHTRAAVMDCGPQLGLAQRETMMKVSIYIDKATAMRAGRDVWGRHAVDVPSDALSPEQRETLARFVDHETTQRRGGHSYGGRLLASEVHGDTDFFLEYKGPCFLKDGARQYADVLRPICLEPTPDAVLACLDAIVAADVQKEADALAETAAKKAAAKELVEAICRKSPEELVKKSANVGQLRSSSDTWHHYAKWGVDLDIPWANRDEAEAVGGDRLRTLRQAAEAVAKQRTAEAKAAAQAECDRDEQQHAAVQAKVEEHLTACCAYRAQWVQEYGTDSMRERLAEDLLDPEEVMGAARDWIFGPLADWPRYDRIRLSDVCTCEDPDETDCRLQCSVEDAEEVTAGEFERLKEARVLLPEATITVRIHECDTDECKQRLIRGSLHVAHAWGPYTLSREYALD